MLTFFRKYQKFFFIIVTAVTVFSFVFFGTYQAFSPSGEREDPIVFSCKEGRKIRKSYFEKFAKMLGEENTSPLNSHIINDGILLQDIFEPGLAHLVFENSLDVKEELLEKFKKEKHFTPYAHAKARFLSSESIWSSVGLDIGTKLDEYKRQDSFDFSKKVALHLSESAFPSPFLAYMLKNKAREFQLEDEGRFQAASLSLFGYKNSLDWFGEKFINRCAELILRGAEFAKARGYKVTKEELISEVQMRLERARYRKGQADNPENLLHAEMRELYLGEDELAQMLSDVLLFRRVMNDAAGAILPDSEIFRSFYRFADETLDIELFEVATPFDLKNEQDFKRFECYLANTASHRSPLTLLPEAFDSIDTIEKRNPSFIRKSMILEVKSLQKKEILTQVPLKTIWEWQSNEENQKKLKEKFPGLSEKEKLDEKTAYLIAMSHPEWIEEALKNKKGIEKSYLLSSDGRGFDLPGISNPGALLKLLETSDKIFSYTQDEENFYQIEVKSRGEEKSIVTYKDAIKEGLLDDLLVQDNAVPLERAREIVDLCEAKGIRLSEKWKDKSIEEKASRLRFSLLLTAHREGYKSKMPWEPVRKEISLTRSKPHFISFNEARGQAMESFSNLILSDEGKTFYYRVSGKRDEIDIPKDRLFETQMLLGDEAKKDLAKVLLQHV